MTKIKNRRIRTMNISKTASTFITLAVGTLLLVSLSGGCAKSAPSAPSPVSGVQGETPVAPEKNPPGDIPDTQVFITYRSTDGQYQLEVPEGWARSMQEADVSFIDKLDGIKVTISQASAAPTAASVRTNEVAALLKSSRAVQVDKIQDVQLPSGAVVLVAYSSNSDPDPVTGKQVRLENNLYLYFKGGRLAALTLWAPLGADNVDQWQRISQSFRWS
jgi:hypothetical protein